MFFAILITDPPLVIPNPTISERGRFGLGAAFQRRTTPFDTGALVVVVCCLYDSRVGSHSHQKGSGPGAKADVVACVLNGTAKSFVLLPEYIVMTDTL